MYKLLLLIGLGLVSDPVLAIWSCSSDLECTSLSGSVCVSGECVCPVGTQVVAGGTLCAEAAPYHSSPCFEDHQCSRLFTGFHCRRDQGDTPGTCQCLPGHHFLKGRCWLSRGYGESCTRHEECLDVIRDVNSLACDGTCGCAEGFFERQRGECRRAGLAVGDGCVLDQDCLFPSGACNLTTFTCFATSDSPTLLEAEVKHVKVVVSNENKMAAAGKMAAANELAGGQHGAICNATNPCGSPLVCASFGICVCPLGYYANANGTLCMAELQSPSTEEQCVGLFVTVADGVCTCPANFFFQENMRDCIKVSRFITDSCIMDESCHTFGAASRCGAPQTPWGLRSCECIPEKAVWDRQRSMCRLFAGIGESCEVDSDCLAGSMEIQCLLDDQGKGTCACPDHLAEFEGLCITAGLELGDACQVSQECTGADNAVCEDGRCSCDNGYQQVDDFCAPVIGGRCLKDTDCVIENTVCRNDSNIQTCQCGDRFVEENDVCWPVATGFQLPCNVSVQCSPALGDDSQCLNGLCVCLPGHHYRDDRCWPMTGLFESCSRRSQCFLGDITDRVVCRNSLCQCDFRYPFSEQLNTCTSSASSITASITIFGFLIYLLL